MKHSLLSMKAASVIEKPKGLRKDEFSLVEISIKNALKVGSLVLLNSIYTQYNIKASLAVNQSG